MIKISFQNAGGELDSRTVGSAVDVPEAISAMVMAAGEIFPGDKIIVTDTDEGRT